MAIKCVLFFGQSALKKFRGVMVKRFLSVAGFVPRKFAGSNAIMRCRFGRCWLARFRSSGPFVSERRNEGIFLRSRGVLNKDFGTEDTEDTESTEDTEKFNFYLNAFSLCPLCPLCSLCYP
jgi:hypothetical protein